ncbi:hypothetical protein ACLB2K_027106 [Fragaria x ananassa]
MDGSRNRTGGISAGGVIRDHTGVWIGGFMVNIGVGEVLQAEAWGLFYGIQLALSLDIPNLEQFDSIQINHIHRERNTIANILAKNSTLNAHDICNFQKPPVIVIEALLDDIAGFARSRSFSSSNTG